ncbi:hypothetical protein RhiirA4_546427 [Rhizophagus irregularis]|uniref:Uncharacterized protein n=1 Tax=Rhizophagus irregularis TaxID=588596 RepID=A0A2I1GX62_9GLOM|nr:hypothetical protein RhiirA4_546427 [Rhizophagus irregularis]
MSDIAEILEQHQNDNDNNNKSLRLEALNIQAWAGIFYILIWNPIWTILCFIWVLVTCLLSIITLVFPPLGFIVCIGTVISWRTLARVELLTTTFSSNPKHFHNDTVPQITRRMALPLLTRISETQGGPFTAPHTNFCQKTKEFCFNEYTLNCAIYFLGRKPLSMIYYFIKYLLLLVFSFFPLTVCILPHMCKSSRITGAAEVYYSRRWLLPGWVKPQRDQNQQQNMAMVV